MGFGRVHPSFWPCGFRRGWSETSLLSVAIMEHLGVSIFMVKTMAKNVIVAKVWGLVMADWVFKAMRTLLGISWLVAAASASGGGNTGGVQSLIFQCKNWWSDLNWLCLTMAWLKAFFWECGLSPGWKPNIYDRAVTTRVHCFLLWAVTFGEFGLRVLSWQWFVLQL